MGDALADKYAAILMPEPMMAISLVANRFFVPDGCALIRLLETGVVFRENGKLNCDKLKVRKE